MLIMFKDSKPKEMEMERRKSSQETAHISIEIWVTISFSKKKDWLRKRKSFLLKTSPNSLKISKKLSSNKLNLSNPWMIKPALTTTMKLNLTVQTIQKSIMIRGCSRLKQMTLTKSLTVRMKKQYFNKMIA